LYDFKFKSMLRITETRAFFIYKMHFFWKYCFEVENRA
jgi:hypothetical protein